MMTSYPENIVAISKAIIATNPSKILDIGSAFGKYAILAREALLSDRAERGDLTPADDLQEMAKYFHELPYHANLYQNHWHMDARFIDWPSMPKYDLVLMIDVIEHWPKEDGIKLINSILNQGMKILVSTPKDVYMYEQDFYGKDCPKHETQWSRQSLYTFGLDHKYCEDFSTEQSHIILIA